MPSRSLKIALLALVALPFTGCNTKERIEFELGKFKEELKEEREEAALKVELAESKVRDLESRLAAIESNASEAMTVANNAIAQQQEGFSQVSKSMDEIVQYQKKDETYAYIWEGFDGHTALRTEHGAFLIRLESVERDFDKGVFLAKLNIGNPMGLHILEFQLSGDFGERAPKIEDGEDRAAYGERIEEWQKTLTPFQTTVVETLKPNSWTEVVVPLNAESREQLQLMRFAMKISRAHLDGQQGNGELTAVNLTGEGAVKFESDYGAFLGTVEKVESEGSGIRVYMMIGNPFGFTLNSCKVSGVCGALPPRQLATENAEAYSQRFIAWSDSLSPFESQINEKILPFRWSNVSFFVPDGSTDTIQLLRAKLSVENVTLKAPGS